MTKYRYFQFIISDDTDHTIYPTEIPDSVFNSEWISGYLQERIRSGNTFNACAIKKRIFAELEKNDETFDTVDYLLNFLFTADFPQGTKFISLIRSGHIIQLILQAAV